MGKPSVAKLLGELAEMMNRLDPDHPEVDAFIDARAHNKKFAELAATARMFARMTRKLKREQRVEEYKWQEPVARLAFEEFLELLTVVGPDDVIIDAFIESHRHLKEFANVAASARFLRRTIDEKRKDLL